MDGDIMKKPRKYLWRLVIAFKGGELSFAKTMDTRMICTDYRVASSNEEENTLTEAMKFIPQLEQDGWTMSSAKTLEQFEKGI